jgi:hypothetical protein
MSRQQKSTFTFTDIFPDADFTCNREDEVFQYFQQLLSEKNAEIFEQHLKTCSRCASRLADLHETAEAGESTAIDARKADDIFRQTLSKLEDRLGVESTPKLSPAIYAQSKSRFRIPAYVNLILVGLVALLIYPSYKSFVLDEEVAKLQNELNQERSRPVPAAGENIAELKQGYEKEIQRLNAEREKSLQPDLAGSSVYSVRSERGSSVETIPVNFSENRTAHTLVFSVQNTDYKNYIVEILQEGKTVWQDQINLVDQSTAEGSLISVTLKANSLKEGNYRLKISGSSPAGTSPISEYRLNVKKS